MSGINRKEFLKTGALSSLFLGSGLFMTKPCTQVQRSGEAKNVIFLVSDGMSAATLQMTDTLLKRMEGRTSNWIQLYDEDYSNRALMDMASADRLVTGSAAASSSWGSGHRVKNGVVNVGENGEEYKAILPIFKDAGKATGLVTTTEITHATPAGFVANVEQRGMQETIAEQYLEHEIDLLFGGGNRHYAPEMRDDGKDMYEEHRKKGYSIVRTKPELSAMSELPDKILGIFFDGHLPYSLDLKNNRDLSNEVPTLAELTDKALQRLSRSQDGFILQVEGGRVDHAAHGNDVGGMLFDQAVFDDAISIVLKFAVERDDTLVIVTTDHGNANPGFSGAPNDQFDKIFKFSYTNDWIHRDLNADSTINQIRDRVEAATNFGITRQEGEAYLKAIKGDYEPVYKRMSSRGAVLGQILANYTQVNWISGSHTSDYVELVSFGPGSEALQGFVRNTDLFEVMVSAAGVEEYAEKIIGN